MAGEKGGAHGGSTQRTFVSHIYFAFVFSVQIRDALALRSFLPSNSARKNGPVKDESPSCAAVSVAWVNTTLKTIIQ